MQIISMEFYENFNPALMDKHFRVNVGGSK